MTWDCEGKRQDGTNSAMGQHDLRSVHGDECTECNLSRVEVTGSSGPTTIIGQPGRKLSPLYAIPVVALCIIGGGNCLG